LFLTAAEWYNKYKKIPDLDTIQTHLTLDPDQVPPAEKEKHKDLILWYYDRWMPIVAGKHFWHEEIQYFKLITDTQPIAGKEKVNCTVTSEAFGLLVNYENYHETWERQLKFKDKYGKSAELPKSKTDVNEDGKTIDYYKSKWSNSTSGQVKYAGWDPAAYTRMAELQKWVQTFRNDDEKVDKKIQKYALKVIQEKNKKKIDKKQPKKKRSRKEPPKDSAKKLPKIVRLDE